MPTDNTQPFALDSDGGIHPTESINEMRRQFWNSAVLRAYVRLDVFRLLDDAGPLDAAGVAGRLGGNERFTGALLTAAEALGLLERTGSAFGLSDGAR